MSVDFGPPLRVVGYQLRCAFTTTVYTDDVVPNHPLEGGCSAARQFADSVAAVGYEQTWDTLGEPVNFGDENEDACLRWAGTSFTRPVYADEPRMNVANTNAMRLFAALEFDMDDDVWCGSMDATEFLSRVLVAQGFSVGDPGRPAEMRLGERGARVVDCGRDAGYTDERLDQLAEIATFAREHGVPVTWG